MTEKETVMSETFFERVGTNAREQRGEGQAGNEPAPPISNPGLPTTRPTGSVTVRRWARSDDIFWQASETIERLEPAFYKFTDVPNIGPALLRSSISTDGLIHVPDTVGERVLAEFETFWGLRERFQSRGFLHKRGIMLWGPPGSGKTCSLMLMSDQIINKHGGIVCLIEHPLLAAACLQMIRKIEPDRPIVALMEDLDALIQRHGENAFLALLDGETQVDRICYIATTNYPERLDRRFVDRPSRFDTVEFIGMPTSAARRVYLQAKEPTLRGAELDDWTGATDGFSIAHLRELIILVRCFEQPLPKAIERLEKMRLRPPSSDKAPDRAAFGFAG